MDSRLDIYALGFTSMPSPGIDVALRLLESIGGYEAFFRASAADLAHVAGTQHRCFADDYRHNLLARAKREADLIEGKNIRCVPLTDPAYPQLLLECDDAPLSIFTVGEADLNPRQSLAIVGTRHSTPYGQSMIDRIVADLAAVCPGTLIVSGGAYGVDIAAHRAALRYGLPTAWVMAHGFGTIYPQAHRADAASIVEASGALLTEYRFNDPIHKGNFLARNRIVAGSTSGLLVVESKEKGGAMVTARLSSSYGRRLMALPGRATDIYSEGCNKLIASGGASLVTSAEDIIDHMGWTVRSEGMQTQMFADLHVDLPPQQQQIIDALAEGNPVSVSTLSADLSIPPGKLTSILMQMEFSGLVINVPGGKVMKR